MVPIRFLYVYIIITVILIWITNRSYIRVDKKQLNRFLLLQLAITIIILIAYGHPEIYINLKEKINFNVAKVMEEVVKIKNRYPK